MKGDVDKASGVLAVLDAAACHHRVTGCGIAVHWREWGQGLPLVLLHGGHGSWMHWVRNIDSLSRHFRVLVPDLPGCGDSEDFDLPPHDPARLEFMLQALRQSIAALVPEGSLHLAGFSFGGAIAGMLAPRLPRLSRLVLLGTGGHGGERRETVPLQDWRCDDPAERDAAWRQNLAAFMLSGPEAVDALAVQVHGRSCLATRFRSKAISRNSRLAPVLEKFTLPVLMVWGENDVTSIPMDAAERLMQDRPEREWTILPKAGHWVQYESAQEVNTLLISWLRSRCGAPASG